ncbi:MAG: hypothetical protein DIU82_05000 [Bacillota bacterium]|nr:MAG: hypothetical protein DIU82_05000 [Bacillota bacterium]
MAAGGPLASGPSRQAQRPWAARRVASRPRLSLRRLPFSLFLLLLLLLLLPPARPEASPPLGGVALAAAIGVSLDGLTVDFGSVSPLDGPRVVRRAVQLAVEADVPWHVTVAAAGDFASEAAGTPALPAARLEWALEGLPDYPWRPLSTVPAVLAQGPGGEGPVLLALSFRLQVGWDDAPATAPYRTQLVYTASPGAALAASFAQVLPGAPGEPVRFAIGYWLPGEGSVPVRIQLATAEGVPVRTVVQQQTGGRWHTWEWDGTDDAGQPLPPGVYYYTVTGPDGQLLAAGACVPPEVSTARLSSLSVRALEPSEHGTQTESALPPLVLEAVAHPDQVQAGEWLRLEWTLANPGAVAVRGVRLELNLPAWLRPVAPAAEKIPGYTGWAIAVDDLPAGAVRRGHVWMAVAPFAPEGSYQVFLTAREAGSWAVLSETATVPVKVTPGYFAAGRLVARVVPAEAAAKGIAFRVVGGPRLETDETGVLTWSGRPGLYVLVPEDSTLPPGWHAPPVPVRLAPGTLTYVEIPLLPGEPETAPGQGALAVEGGAGGVRLAAAWRTGDSDLWLHINPARGASGTTAGDEAERPPVAAQLLLPLGWPWSGPLAMYMAGRHVQDEENSQDSRAGRDGRPKLHMALMAGAAAFAADEGETPHEPLWGLHLVREGAAGTAGVLWVHGEGGGAPGDLLGAHGQMERGPLRVAVQGLWRAGLSLDSASAWGATAAVQLGAGWQVEGTYRLAGPQFAVPWVEQPRFSGWSVGLIWQPPSGAEWRSTVGLSGGDGVDLELAGRVGAWELRQRLVLDGEWRPATAVALPLPGSGWWLGLRAEGQEPLRWTIGGQAVRWTWSLHGGGADEAEVRAAGHLEGPWNTLLRAQGAWRAGHGQLLDRIDARLELSRPMSDGSLWRAELLWQPGGTETRAAAGLAWRAAPGGGRWTEVEIRWTRGQDGETRDARLSRRWSFQDTGEATGQLLLRQARRDGAGGLYSLQTAVSWSRPVAAGWHSTTGVRWSVQWPETIGSIFVDTELELGIGQELDPGVRWTAGWRWPLGTGAGSGGPYVRFEWQGGASAGD